MKKIILTILQFAIAVLAVFGEIYTIYRLFSFGNGTVPLWITVVVWLVLLMILIIIYCFVKKQGGKR